jgi:hypothetical protein
MPVNPLPTSEAALMVWNWLKRKIWTGVVRLHADVRVAAFLRAVSVVGIVAGFSGFMAGLNPLVAPFVVQAYDPGGDTLIRIGVAGLLVHIASLGYYYATAPSHLQDGLMRY